METLPSSQTPARRIVRVILNTFGVACAIFGTYFGVLAIQSLIAIISLSRSSPKSAGLAAPAVMMLGGLQVIEVFVFGALAAFLLAIAVAILQPLTYWRNRRT